MPLPILGAALVIKAATVAAAAAAGAALYQRARQSRSSSNADSAAPEAPAVLQALERENAELRRRLECLEQGQLGQQRP